MNFYLIMSDMEWKLLKDGDLIKLHLSGVDSFYVGYVWYTSRKEFEEAGEERGLKTPFGIRGTYYGIRNADIFLSPISPNGIDKTIDGNVADFNLEFKIQMAGINTKNNTFCGVPVLAYDFIERVNRE